MAVRQVLSCQCLWKLSLGGGQFPDDVLIVIRDPRITTSDAWRLII